MQINYSLILVVLRYCRLFNSPVIFQLLTNKIADICFRSLGTENYSEYSTSENITDFH
jgi:hypothetical protein